ncbi:pyridoxamine 5'-phosphate oxidase family protein [Elongatibacter sediminis]|uniref:Pyridoxamine 5'-phosphate oxidase family protein n=1 Tax=Elongatibacter sediminis TaxID=3119006 RepID=A0AAW9RD54_9GAMM
MLSPAANDASPFHEGERSVQQRVGVREAIEPWARKIVRPYLPEQHREFYAGLPFIVAAARDGEGRPWATLLTGAPGFIASPDPGRLVLKGNPLTGDALDGSLNVGAELGLLGIELETRRRNRVNGHITAAGPGGLELTVGQSFGNCPQYISERHWRRVDTARDAGTPQRALELDRDMMDWIAAADTFFIASGYAGPGHGKTRPGRPPANVADVRHGLDASHRGGPPGFVHVAGSTRLVFPDYAGNNHFNTLGNIQVDPRVGLLFVDFERGSLLQISGRAQIDWDSPEIARHPGAQRLITVNIERIVRLDQVLPLRWSDPRAATRSLRLVERKRESEDVTSFVFEARDGGPLPEFQAGQHLPIELAAPGGQTLSRSYSLSGDPADPRYRISVKREARGAASRLLHDTLQTGDLVAARPPAGDFILRCSRRPLVLAGAGIGITPLASMLHALGHQPGRRPVHLIHGVRDGDHHPLAAEIRAIADRNPNVELTFAYSRPSSKDKEAGRYHRQGRVDIELVRSRVPDLDAEFYLCGPAGFLADLIPALEDNGVDSTCIHFETF